MLPQVKTSEGIYATMLDTPAGQAILIALHMGKKNDRADIILPWAYQSCQDLLHSSGNLLLTGANLSAEFTPFETRVILLTL